MKRENLNSLVTALHQNVGDALKGERVIAQARDIGKVRVVPGTSRHKMQEIMLRSNVLCVLDQSFRLAEQPFRLQSEP